MLGLTYLCYLKMEPIGFHETSVRNHHSMTRKISKERTIQEILHFSLNREFP